MRIPDAYSKLPLRDFLYSPSPIVHDAIYQKSGDRIRANSKKVICKRLLTQQ